MDGRLILDKRSVGDQRAVLGALEIELGEKLDEGLQVFVRPFLFS
jgi:hypothetical protein